jgi:hypothetical protein
MAVFESLKPGRRRLASVYRDLDMGQGNGVSRFKSGLAHAHHTRVMSPDGKRSKVLRVVSY